MSRIPSETGASTPDDARWEKRRGPVRWYCLGVLVALAFDIPLRVRFYREIFQVTLVDDFFPALWRSPWIPPIGYGLCLAAALAGVVHPSRRVARMAAVALAMGCLAHMLHQRGFFWQTFTTTLWGAVWMAWLASRPDESQETLESGATLAQMVWSFVFLGGAVGKWTDGYWSGDVLHHLFFTYQATQPFAWIRGNLAPEHVHALAVAYSRAAVVGETAMAALFLVPPRYSLRASLALGAAMWLVSPAGVIDALAPLFGLAVAGLALLRVARTPA